MREKEGGGKEAEMLNALSLWTPTLSQQSSICGEPPPPTPDTEDTPGPGSMDLNDMYARCRDCSDDLEKNLNYYWSFRVYRFNLFANKTPNGDGFNSCQVIYSQFGLAIHQNDHQARRRFVEWAQNEIAVVPDFHKRILFSDEAHFWLNGYINQQNCRIWSEANPQVYVETPLHPEKLTVWCALWAGGILLQKR
ncbi:hypothetical protein TNCV_4814621 [Trichonephila clavipes]|nr:hypothetical protein TNCV_4814621 [Trichonephila clavipes]